MSEPINVVVPTRERADTLQHCLRSIVAQDCDRLTIWVSDNASGPATREVVESFGDPRIRYRNTGERLSMSHNFEFALSQIERGWIVVIGDDDGLLPGRLEPQIAELEDSGLQALASDTCYYNWPAAVPEVPVRLTVPLGRSTRRVDARAAMATMLELEPYRMRIPQTYTGGIVHADVFQRIRSRRGTFFQSQIPDIYSGFTICGTVDEFLFTRRPYSLAGRSSHSIGTSLFNIEKNTFLDEGLIPFHSDFPMPDVGTLTFSMPAMFFESYTQAAYLHGGNPPLSRQTMLARTIGISEFGREHIVAWGRQFAKQHGLDYAAAMREGAAIARRSRLATTARRLRHLWQTARVFRGDSRPLGNVAEAAQTADSILRNPPGRLMETAATLARYAVKPAPIR